MARPAHTLSASLLALLTAFPAQAQAQDTAPVYLGEIVLSAFRTAAERLRTGVSVSVVDDEDLAAARDLSLSDTLAGLPGVSVTRSGPFGNTSTLRVRGADGRYLAVFIDGIKVSDPSGTNVSFDWGAMLSADVSRVEVLRGSQSALWGGSAVGGVINITTRQAAEDGLHQSIDAMAGSFGTARLTYGLTHKGDRMELAFTATRLQTDGFSAGAGGGEDDGAGATRLSFSTRYKVSDSLTLGGSAFWQDTEQDYDRYTDPDGDYVYDVLDELGYSQSRTERGARVFAELSMGNTDHVFDVSLYDIDRTSREPTGTTPYGGTRTSLGWQASTDVSDVLTLVYGIDWSREEAKSSRLPGGASSTEILGAGAQVIWSPVDSFDLSAALRADHNSTFGTFETWRIALSWRPADGTTLRGAIATGFRAPSIDERFGDYPEFFFTGNPNLQPEESLSYELGAEQALANGATVSATLFRLEVDNLIASSPPFYATLDNLPGTSVRKGLELAATLSLSDAIELGLAYTYTDGRRPDGTRLTLVPRHTLTLSLDGDLSDRLSAGVEMIHVADRIDNDAMTFSPVALPDYTLLNAQMSYDLNDTTALYLKFENLTDKDYQPVSGYAGAGRSAYIGLQAKF